MRPSPHIASGRMCESALTIGWCLWGVQVERDGVRRNNSDLAQEVQRLQQEVQRLNVKVGSTLYRYCLLRLGLKDGGTPEPRIDGIVWRHQSLRGLFPRLMYCNALTARRGGQPHEDQRAGEGRNTAQEH